MLRQMGPPTFFLTNSMADTRWAELLQALVWQARKIDLSREELLALPWVERALLVRNDPVTCARYYRMREETLISTVRKCPETIEKVTDFFSRDEFQHRGAPHTHLLAYVENAPIYGVGSNESICAWIDRYVTVSRTKYPEVKHLLKLQTHKHSRTCRKTVQNCRDFVKCCFHFPIPPLNRTRILDPLPDDFNGEARKQLSQVADRIRDKLHRISKRQDFDSLSMTFEEFLTDFDLSLDQYILAIRSTLKKATVLLKRLPSEIKMNAYNPRLLELSEANMDIQFVWMLTPLLRMSFRI
jgi:hypothetical protein